MNRAHDEPAVVLSRVTAHFGDGPVALKDVSLSIRKGAFVSFAGPSGAGKSTLMRVILGLMPHQGGTVVRNFERSAMVFQNYALFPWLTTLENVAFGLAMAGMGRRDREGIARQKLEEVGLSGLEKHYPVALSGGQRQRVGLARALAISPDLLILDEPFSNLDSITAEALRADLLKIWRQYGMTVLMVNHLLPDTVELSDEVVVLGASPGRIERTIRIPLLRPRDPRSEAFFREVDTLTEAVRAVF
jgi:ABC-type nitrate/sulfonate/bicarbonate transport system ATPase subunit